MIKKLLLFLLLIFLMGCNSDKLSDSKAKSIINRCLEKNPEQRFVNVNLGEVTFREINDELLNNYKKLADQGFIELTLIKEVIKGWNKRKIFEVALTAKAIEYVHQAPENGRFATINSFKYEVEKIMEVYEIPSMNKAEVKVNFQASDVTPFAILSTKNPNQFWVKKLVFTKTNKGWKYCDDI
ncbi:hypothetical protein [Ascidiimonas sp. W6]|uniref:hypothetical protein n=1 Tax=Ascidiimonas meishanensis TaxID=3128903 RepID=UPI0030EF1C2D